MAAPEDAVTSVVAPAVAASGLVLEGVKVEQAGSRSLVRVTVDLPETESGGVGVTAIEEVTKAVSAALDSADPLTGRYVLEVTSPGAERTLTAPRHWRRSRGRLVTGKLHSGEAFRGRVIDVAPDGSSAQIAVAGDATSTILLSDVATARIELEFRRRDDELAGRS